MWKWFVRVANAPLARKIALAVLTVVVDSLTKPPTKRS